MVSDGHICKSEPFDAANFALEDEKGRESLRGTLDVLLQAPKVREQPRSIIILIPPRKLTVNNTLSLFNVSVNFLCDMSYFGATQKAKSVG